MAEKTRVCEVLFITEVGTWKTVKVRVPTEVLDQYSHDAFIAWVYSEDGEDFRSTWSKRVITVYLWHWAFGLTDPRLPYLRCGWVNHAR